MAAEFSSKGYFYPHDVVAKEPEAQWTKRCEKAANLDQRLKSHIMSVLPDDQMNYVINFLTTKSTWDDLICLIVEAYEWDEEEVSSDDNEMVEVKVLMALAEDDDLAAMKVSNNARYESFVCRPLILTEKLDGVEPVSGPKTIKSILKSKSTFKAETLKCVIINKPSSAPAKSNKRSSTSKHRFHTITDHNDIEWFRRGEEIQAKKAEVLKPSKAESSNANRPKTPTRRYWDTWMLKAYDWCQELLHKYVSSNQDLRFDFGDGTLPAQTEGYGSIKCIGIVFTKDFESSTTRRQTNMEKPSLSHLMKRPDAIKFLKPLVNNINIAKTKRYMPDEYLHPYKPSQRYQINRNDVSFIEPYKRPEPVVLETKVLSDQNGQADQNDQTAQTDEILNDDLSEHSNHTNDEQIIDSPKILERHSDP
ncbi:hypothetical protein Tco_0078280 [Tanacetum coccineum]